MEVATRLSALRERMGREGAGAFAAVSIANVAYVTGFENVFDTEEAHVALVTPDSAELLTDSRYVEAATSAAKGSPWRVTLVTADMIEAVGATLEGSETSPVALETSLPHARYEAFAKRLDGKVLPAAGWIEEIRTVKEPAEIERIAAAQALTDRAFEYVLSVLAAGRTERDVALELEFFMRRGGSEGVAFPPIIAGGPNSALPHALPGEREFRDGDFVVMDFGARVGGYCADMTRTVVIGAASDRHREIYETVLSANAAGIGAVRAGRVGKDVDAVAREIIAERGFGEHFGHGLGHGVGREVHEAPGVGPRSDKPLPAGSVVTVEPGVYIPGYGGVRIEDLVVVEDSGARVLTASSKDLIEV